MIDAAHPNLLGLQAPSQFLGDLSQYHGGTIAFDAIRFTEEYGGSREFFGQIQLTGPGGTATIDVAPHEQVPDEDRWSTYSASLAGVNSAILSDVESITVTVEHFKNTEVIGFDNFQLSTNLADTAPLIANRGDLRTFAVGDIDSDGHDDFAVSQTTASGNELTRYSGQTLEVAGEFNGSSSTSSLVYTSATTADLNGDGRPDLIATRTNPGSENSVEAYYQDPSGIFLPFIAESISAESIDDDFGILPLTPGIDLNRDGREDLLVTAPGYDGTGDDIGKAYVVYGGLGQSSANLNSFEVLANHTISGSGDFLVDRGTGRPAEFRNLPVSDENRLFRFTTLGDAEAGHVIRVLTDGATETIRNSDKGFLVRAETIAAILLDEEGGMIEQSGNQFDLRGLAAGTYFLQLFNADGGSIPANTTVTITAVAPLAGDRRNATDRDVVRGGDGDDTLTGSGELDRLFGESGQDSFVSNQVEIFDLEDDESRDEASLDNDVSNVAFDTESAITFGDTNLRDALATAVGLAEGSDIFPSDVKNLIELDLSGKSISNLKGLEAATNLRSLSLADNDFTLLKPSEHHGLHGLTKLEFLAVDNNSLTSLEGIESSPFLKRLSLTSNPNLTPNGLAPLAKLQFVENLQVTPSDLVGLAPVLGHVTRFGHDFTTADGSTVEFTAGTLVVHSGALLFRRLQQLGVDDESFTLEQTAFSNGEATIQLFASINGADYSQIFTDVTSILIDGGAGTDSLSLIGEIDIPIRTFNTTTPTTGSGADNIVITGLSGSAMHEVVSGGGDDIIEISRGDGVVPAATIMGGAGNDTVIIDTTAGLLGTNATIEYDGGVDGNDVLSIVGSTALTSVTYQVDNANPQNGVLIHEEGISTQTINFSNLEPVLDTSMSPVLEVQQAVDLSTVINNTVVFDAGPQSGSEPVGFHLTGRVQFDESEYIEFANKEELVLSTGAGTDSVLLNHPGQVDGLTEITVEGGSGSTDSVTVVEVDSASNIVYTPDDADGGMLTGAQAVPVTVNAVNTLVVDGQNSAIDLQLPQTSGADSVTVEATGSDSGTITRGSTLPLSFANAGAGSSILIDDSAGGSNDLLTFNGSSDADSFRISTDTGSSNGVIDLSGLEVAVETASVESANIDTGAEDDLVELTGPLPFTLSVAGGTGNDTLLLNPNGTSITIDVSGANPVVYGGGVGTQSEPLAISQFETITLAAADANVSIVGGNRSLSYTPALSGSGAVFVQELGLTLDLTSVGTLSVSLAAGGSADVLGDAAGNHAVVDRGASTLVTVDALTPITLTGTVADLTLRLGDGHDSFDVRGSGGPATITLHGDDGSEGGDTDASLRFEGASLQESYAYSSSSGHAGQLVHGGSTIAFTGISDAQLRGNGGDDTLAVQSDSTDSIVTFTAGIAADSGSVQVDSLLPLNFSKVGVGGSVHIAGSSGQDTLRYRGSGADDSYVISETGDVELNGRIMVTTSGVETYDLDGGGGADSLQIAVPIGDVEIDLATGHLTGNLSSSTTPGTIQLAATESLQITGSGRKANRLTISGYGELTAFESVTFDGGFQSDTDDADTVTLQLADVGNDLTVSVTSDQAASISGSNAAPVIDIGGLDATAGRFRIDGGGGTDSLIINGESGADVFQATAGEVGRTVDDQNRMPVAYSGFESVVLSGLAGADTFNVTPSSVPTTVRGGEAAVPQDDVLRVDAGASDVSHSFGESGDAGGIAVVANALISYSGVEGVSVEGDATGTLSLTGTDGPDSFIVTATGTSDFDVVNDSTSVAYTNFATLSLQTLNGNDRVEVTPVITGVDWGVTATLDLGDGVADSVVVNGDGTHQTLEFTPALDSLLIDATAADLSIPGAESLLYRGHGGDDDVIIRATGELRYSVGATNDSGTLDMQSEVPLEFQSLGAGGLIQADFPDAGMPAAPPHRLVIVGTSAADAFEVEPRRVEPGNGIAITHNLTNAETLELIGGLTGDADSVDVSSVHRSLRFAEQTTPNDHNDTDDGLIQLPVEIINGRTSLTAEFRYQAPASLADLVASGQTHLTFLVGSRLHAAIGWPSYFVRESRTSLWRLVRPAVGLPLIPGHCLMA